MIKPKLGFYLDEFGGNFDLIIIESEPDELNNSSALKTFSGEGRFKKLVGQSWSFFDAHMYSHGQIERLAQELSQELLIKAIYFYYGDASGWMGYKLFQRGEEIEEYSFGESYEEEMVSMGIELNQSRKEGTIVTTNEEDEQFIFWSQIRSQSEPEIRGGEKFIDQFLRLQQAYIGWDLFAQS